MKIILILALLIPLFGGCALYQAQTMDDHIKQIKAVEGSGCAYFRGNARPYADVSVLMVSTWGKNAPKYLDCLQNIPENARSLLP